MSVVPWQVGAQRCTVLGRRNATQRDTDRSGEHARTQKVTYMEYRYHWREEHGWSVGPAFGCFCVGGQRELNGAGKTKQGKHTKRRSREHSGERAAGIHASFRIMGRSVLSISPSGVYCKYTVTLRSAILLVPVPNHTRCSIPLNVSRLPVSLTKLNTQPILDDLRISAKFEHEAPVLQMHSRSHEAGSWLVFISWHKISGGEPWVIRPRARILQFSRTITTRDHGKNRNRMPRGVLLPKDDHVP